MERTAIKDKRIIIIRQINTCMTNRYFSTFLELEFPRL